MEQVIRSATSGFWLRPRKALNLAEARLACAATRRKAACCVADLRDSKPGTPVFNRTVTLRDSWTSSLSDLGVR
jgi:hypothetical protein